MLPNPKLEESINPNTPNTILIPIPTSVELKYIFTNSLDEKLKVEIPQRYNKTILYDLNIRPNINERSIKHKK